MVNWVFEQPTLCPMLDTSKKILEYTYPVSNNRSLTEKEVQEAKIKCKTDSKPKDPCILAVQDLIKRIHEHM